MSDVTDDSEPTGDAARTFDMSLSHPLSVVIGETCDVIMGDARRSKGSKLSVRCDDDAGEVAHVMSSQSDVTERYSWPMGLSC